MRHQEHRVIEKTVSHSTCMEAMGYTFHTIQPPANGVGFIVLFINRASKELGFLRMIVDTEFRGSSPLSDNGSGF
jgi:hypothetical protein